MRSSARPNRPQSSNLTLESHRTWTTFNGLSFTISQTPTPSILTSLVSRGFSILPPLLPSRYHLPISIPDRHKANPSQSDDYDRDIIDPAVNATLSILNAAHRTPSIKRVVITSSAVTLISFAWMFDPAPASPDLTLFTAADINSNIAGPYGTAMEAYFASKTLSRIATRKFMEGEEKPEFEFVNLLPTVVFGPDERATNAAELVTAGNYLALGPLLDVNVPQMAGATVHVDDAARAHIDALKPTVQGNRDYILSSDAPDGLDWADAQNHIRRIFPEAVENGTLKLGSSSRARTWRLDTRETEKEFGWKFVSFKETLRELVGQYLMFVAAAETK